MTTQMRSYGRGLRMPLLALTASASIVGGIFVAAQPAYSVDGVAGATGQCLTAADEGASIVVSSVVPVGSPLHVEGSGWGASTETMRGFVVVTLDDGQEVRPDGVTLPVWVPVSVVRNKAAWSVAEVSTTGSFSADIELPSTWTVGSEHSIMIGDGVTGTYVQVSVTVVESGSQVPACSLTPADDSSVEPTEEPSNQPSAEPDDHATSDVVTDGPTESPADDAAHNDAKPVIDLTDDASGDAAGDASASAPSTVTATPSPRPASPADASDASRSSAAPAPSASSASSSGGSGSSSATGGGVGSSADAPSPSPSAEQESVSASQIGPKAHSEQQATNQAVREQESRLNGWILAGGGLLALLGAIVTVSIVRRSHGLLR